MGLRKRWKPGDRFLIHHKDSAMVVVDKKAGLLTVGRPSERGADLMTLLTEVLGGDKYGPRVYPVQRLDRPVSGLIVVARTRGAEAALTDQLRQHTMLRRYTGCVQGILEQDTGTFQSTLANAGLTLRMRSAEEGEVGRRAVTHWRVLERLPEARATLVEIELETGLRNQIRVHFSEAGHTLLGEKKYLDEDEAGASSVQGTQRLFLHAGTLGFAHPDRGRPMEFTSPLPPDLSRWLERLRRGEDLRVLPRRKTAPHRRFAPNRR